MRVFHTQWKLLFVFMIVLAAVMAYNIDDSRRVKMAEEEGHLSNLAAISADIIERRMLGADQLLQVVIESVPTWAAANAAANAAATKEKDKNRWALAKERLAQLVVLGQGAEVLLLLSPTGEILADSRDDLAGLSAAHRAYFQDARAAADSEKRIISLPFETVFNNFTFAISRQFRDREGRVVGVVAAAMDMAFIGQLLQRMRYADDVESALIHGKGMQIMAIPGNAEETGRDLAVPGSFFTRHRDSGAIDNFLVDAGAYSGQGRMMALHTMQLDGLNIDNPLVLSISRDVREALAEWRQRTLVWGMIFLAVTLLACGGLWSYQRKHRQDWETILRKQTLVDTATDGMLLLDSSGMLVDANPAFFKMVGLTSADIGRVRIDAVDIGHDYDAILERIRHLRETGAALRFETRYRHSGGNIIDVEISCCSLEEQGHALVVASSRDVTERKATEKELARLHQAVEQTPEGICITNTDGKIEYVNRAFMVSSGYSWDELVGRNPGLLSAHQTPREVYENLWATLHAGQIWAGELLNRRKSGECFTESVIISPVREDDGRITGYLAIKQDITEKKQMQHELEAYREHLEEMVANKTAELQKANASLTVANEAANQAVRAKAAFLSNMSHEIRTPMNGIIGMLHLLRRSHMDAQQRGHLAKIEQSARHLLALVNDILDLSKIDADKMLLESLPVNVPLIVANVCSIIGETVRKKGLTVVTDLDPLPSGLLGDTTRLTQVLLNYTSNAVKFTERGQITIRVRAGDSDDQSAVIRFEVEDTGIGVEQQDLERLFQAFEQADNSTTRVYQGSGLGLAINRQLAVLMGGDAGAISPLGQGSCFWFAARLARGEHDAATTASAVQSDAESRVLALHAGKRVLLVEDE
ncbi:MAG: PAS domain S-box protein, partial [Betaproteobacteria bacterium]|nr:PAS domain S-box protein [Betaproteobacteria bacterium]